MAERIVFPGKQQVALEQFEPPRVGRGQLAIRSLCSLMSTGTEGIVFNRLFEPDTHWNRWVKYPFYPGYALVGEVKEIGPEVEGFHVGDRVAARVGHASQQIVPATACYPVPNGIALQDAAWFALAKIAFAGARAAGHVLGDRVLIIGAGPIGQMTTRWAVAAGAEVVAIVDPVERRLEIARHGGATHCLSCPLDDCGTALAGVVGGHPLRVVIDSTGNPAVLSAATRLAPDQGRIVILGDTGTPSQQHITSDVIRRRLTIVGAHDSYQDPEWSEARVTQLFFQLLRSGRINMDGMNTHQFVPADCGQAYEIANTRRGETMGILFDWTAGEFPLD